MSRGPRGAQHIDPAAARHAEPDQCDRIAGRADRDATRLAVADPVNATVRVFQRAQQVAARLQIILNK